MLLSRYATPAVELEPTSALPGRALWSQWSGQHADLPPLPLFLDLHCPKNPAKIAAQFHLWSLPDRTLVGTSTLFKLDPHAGHVRAGVYSVAGHHAEDIHEHALLLTLHRAFSIWNIRKVYLWAVAGTTVAPNGLTRHEGTLMDYLYDGERRLDLDIVAVPRDVWEAAGVPLLAAASASR